MPSVEITCWGHPNVRGTHRTTWEITKEKNLTPRGDCIIGVNASMGPKELPKNLKSHLQSGGMLTITLSVGGLSFSGTALGHPLLSLSHPDEMVFRKSEFISDRTVAINCSFASIDIPREILDLMKDDTTKMYVTLAWDD